MPRAAGSVTAPFRSDVVGSHDTVLTLLKMWPLLQRSDWEMALTLATLQVRTQVWVNERRVAKITPRVKSLVMVMRLPAYNTALEQPF